MIFFPLSSHRRDKSPDAQRHFFSMEEMKISYLSKIHILLPSVWRSLIFFRMKANKSQFLLKSNLEALRLFHRYNSPFSPHSVWTHVPSSKVAIFKIEGLEGNWCGVVCVCFNNGGSGSGSAILSHYLHGSWVRLSQNMLIPFDPGLHLRNPPNLQLLASSEFVPIS